MRSAAELISTVWGRPDLMPAELLRAFDYTGGYVSGAHLGGAPTSLVGVCAGFLGRDAEGVFLHSHVTGVLPSLQGRTVGLILKQHQRDWALANGADRIQWTFDPLVRRNAYFNLTRLGARAVEYHDDFYGDGTDRWLVRWDVGDRPVAEPWAAREPVVILDDDGSGGPRTSDERGLSLAAWIPEDVRDLDADHAQAWRDAVRDTVGRAVQAGYHAVAMSRTGWYQLERP